MLSLDAERLSHRWLWQDPFRQVKTLIESRIPAPSIADGIEGNCPSLPDSTKDCRYLSISKLRFEDLTLVGVNFEGLRATECEFVRCSFQQCSFLDANFKNCEFRSCDLGGSCFINATFLGGKLSETTMLHANLHRLTLEDVDIDTAEVIFCRRVRESLCSKFDTSLNEPKTSFDSTKSRILFWIMCVGFVGLPSEYKRLSELEVARDATGAHRLARKLQALLLRGGHFDQARIAEFHAQRTALLIPRKRAYKAIWEWVQYVLAYFISPERIILLSALVIVVFANLYAGSESFTVQDSSHSCTSDTLGCVESSQGEYRRTLGWLEALYFSTVTFTTLGYGDISPSIHPVERGWENVVLVLPMVEAIAGAILMAMIVASLVRYRSFS